MKNLTATEHAEQCAVVAWFDFACHGYGLPPFALFSVPNGSVLAGDPRRRAMQMHNLKRSGLTPGIPDLCLAARCPRDPDAGALWIEMKRKPNKPSAEQVAVIDYLRRAGYHAVIAWDADEAITAIKAYLKPKLLVELTNC